MKRIKKLINKVVDTVYNIYLIAKYVIQYFTTDKPTAAEQEMFARLAAEMV